jgi:hypothetical protein
MMALGEGPRILRFVDDPGTDRRRGRSAESKAAEFLLEHRFGARKRSISGCALPPSSSPMPSEEVDYEGTCRAIARALGVLPSMWQGPVLVAAGWRLGVRGLRDAHPRDGGEPYLARAGFSTELPQGFGRAALASFTRTFREALFARGLAEQGVEALPASPRAVRYVDPDLLEGRDAIAFHAGCSVRTVQRWLAEGEAPIHRTPSGRVWALASELDAWRLGVPARDAG